MKEFKFISEDIILPYKEYCLTIGSWTPHRRSCLHCFDTYCFENWPGTMGLTQEMVDKWCSKRPTEKISTMGARIRPIQHFLRYLRERGRTTLCDPKIPPVKRHSADIPHHFTEDELCDFFYACDHAEFYWQHGCNSQNLRLTLPVFFRLLYGSGIRPMGGQNAKA